MAKKTRALISFDYALKRLLRNKANFDVLEGFLSELLMQKVKVRNILESESNKTHEKDKQNKVDIMVEDTKNEIIMIELQFEMEFDYLLRMLYGASKAVTEYVKEGDAYTVIRKVYAIHVVYFDLGQGSDYVYHGDTSFKGLHTQDELRLSETQQKEFKKDKPSDLYPEYYILKINTFDKVAENTLDEWIYFLKTNTIKDEFTAQGLDKARAALVYENLTEKEREEYNTLQEARRRNLKQMVSAKAEGGYEAEKKAAKALAEKDTVIAAERKANAEKDAALAEKEAALAAEREANAEKDAALAAEREALTRALAELAALKKK
ncbi:MAG: Rpn family recombination-promoting nuclease/putative transposase [Prevotellaceae bacterium]|nr:Rpn family recombination-promoting nuclease/putative transposase [Prevotellaceae bacterium]